jgi:hypothetical protein
MCCESTSDRRNILHAKFHAIPCALGLRFEAIVLIKKALQIVQDPFAANGDLIEASCCVAIVSGLFRYQVIGFPEYDVQGDDFSRNSLVNAWRVLARLVHVPGKRRYRKDVADAKAETHDECERQVMMG